MLDKPDRECVEDDVSIFPAAFAQQRLWFIDRLLPGESLYVIPLVFRLTGTLERSLLDRSIQAIVERHESLRTTLDMVDGQLMQIVAQGKGVPLQFTDLRSIANSRENVALVGGAFVPEHHLRQEIEIPFDLSRGPLLRVHLWQLQDTEHLLVMTLHHIIFDEWSSGVLMRELGALYTALVEDRPAVLPELPIQYADFAHWQREWLQGEVLNAQLGYWKQQLQDVPLLELPGATGRGEISCQHRGDSQLLEFPQGLLAAVEELSRQAGTTLFMTLLAAFGILLHRYTGQTDLAIGSPIANRHRSELEGLIGFLVNSLVLRIDLAGEPTFRQVLERVRDMTLAAYAHQDLPFEKLVEELQPVRSLDRNPLFQVVFALQNAPVEQLVLPGLALSPVALGSQTSRFDLEVYLWKSADNFRNLWGEGWQQADGLRGAIVYNPDRFDPLTITALIRQFQTLLTGIVADPGDRISALPLLTPEERAGLLQQWHGDRPSNPLNTSIDRQFELQASQRPNAIAVKFGSKQFSYEQLDRGSNQLARYLQTLGVGSQSRVGICLERSVEAIAAMLAVLKVGGAYVPLDPSYPPERLQFMVADAEIAVVLTQANWADIFPSEGVRSVCLEREWEAISQATDEPLATPCASDRLAYIIYTSGSTGTPKGVMVPHRAVMRLVCQTDYMHISPADKIAQVANISFDAATFEIWGALLNGAQSIGIDRETALSPTALATALEREGISILFLTTALFDRVAIETPTAFRSLKYLLFGGELANVERVRSVVAQGKPQHLIHVYGPTENTTFSTWYEVQAVPDNAVTIPIGRAIANTQVYLFDAQLDPVPAGAIGEIYLGGAGLAQGYLNREKLTAQSFIQTEFGTLCKTGDRAIYRADGNFEFLGRTDDLIKLRGFRVELGEIETVLARHPKLQAAVAIVRELAGHQQIVAYVVPKDSAQPTEQDLRLFLKPKLPDYMLPAAFIGLDTLPLTANGKVDRQALPAPHLLVETSPTVSATNSLEASLVEVWQQLLGRKQVGIHDNFFELGGHSLLATQLVSRIRDRFGVEFPLRSVFETPTIAALATQIARLQGVESGPHWQAGTQPREEIEL